MSTPEKRNLAASVRQRLLELGRKRGEPFDLILTRYGIERLLYRLGMSAHADRFLLKGAMLFRVWEDSSHRPTRDLDLLGIGSAEASDLESIFREVCSLAAEPDGLLFMPSSVKARPIREEAVYGGIRVTLEARLENAKIPIQCDIGFGDAVTPEPEHIEFPALLDFPAPHLRAYPIYTVVAEKLEAMVLLGETNSRMKDFYDIWYLSRHFEFDGDTLAKALRATFTRRKTELPTSTPYAFSEDFSKIKAVQWGAFLRKSQLGPIDMPSVVESIHRFANAPLAHASRGERLLKSWSPEAGWR
jgi:predicted nucleotidyltransferase component of viral defense system